MSTTQVGPEKAVATHLRALRRTIRALAKWVPGCTEVFDALTLDLFHSVDSAWRVLSADSLHRDQSLIKKPPLKDGP